MNIKTRYNDILPVPKELEVEFQAWLKYTKTTDPDWLKPFDLSNLERASECFMEFYKDRWESGCLNEEVVSPEYYDLEIAIELENHCGSGGYPNSWTMKVPGYEVTCFGWMEDKGDGIRMLAKAVDKNE